MKPTQTAFAGRLLQSLSKLHPNGPPTAKESNQLLRTLQMSFQKELDMNHPDPKAPQKVADSMATNLPGLGESNLQELNEQHWSTIAVGMNPAAANKQRLVVRLEKLLDQPVVDLAELDQLLQTYLTTIKREGQRSDRDPLYDRLDRWLWCASMEVRKGFFQSDCLHTAMRTLWHQKHETVVWKWLEAVYQRQTIDAPISSRRWLFIEDVMVSTLMRIAKSAGRLEDAATQFVYASRYRIDSGRAAGPDKTTGHSTADMLRLSSRVLASSILQAGPGHGIGPSTFDQLLKYLHPAGHIPTLERDFCAVYHPGSSAWRDLYLHLQDPVHVKGFQDARSSYSPQHLLLRAKALKRAAEAALQDSQPRQAMFLLETAAELGLPNDGAVQTLNTQIQRRLPTQQMAAVGTSRDSFQSLQWSGRTVHTSVHQFIPGVS